MNYDGESPNTIIDSVFLSIPYSRLQSVLQIISMNGFHKFPAPDADFQFPHHIGSGVPKLQEQYFE